MSGESFSVQVDGQTWYCNDIATKKTIESITDVEERKKVLMGLASSSSPIVSLDENAFVDISEMSDDVDTEDVTDDKVDTGEIKGLDNAKYEQFKKSSGLSAFNSLTENSTAEEFNSAIEEISKKADELDGLVSKLASATTPNEIEEFYTNLTNVEAGLKEIGAKFETASTAEPKSDMPKPLQIAGKVLLTVAIISNPIGWVVGGVAKGIKNATEAKKAEAMGSVKEAMSKVQDKINTTKQTAETNVTQAMQGILEASTESLDGMFTAGGDLDFENVSPSDISKNIKTLTGITDKLGDFSEVCTKYGIKCAVLDETIDYFKGVDGKSFTQIYVDSYAANVNMSLTGEVVADTESLNTLYNEISALMTELKAQGLDTTALAGAMESIACANQKAVETAAQGYTPGQGSGDLAGNVAANMDAAAAAYDTAGLIQDGASAYDVNTGAMMDASVNLKTASQQQIDDYVSGIDISSATSLAALDEMYSQINDTYTQLQDAGTFLDVSGIEGKLTEISDKKQEIVDAKQADFENLLNSATTPYEIADVENKIKEYASKHSGDNVDMTGLATLLAVAETKKNQLLGTETDATPAYVEGAEGEEGGAEKPDKTDETSAPAYQPTAAEEELSKKIDTMRNEVRSGISAARDTVDTVKEAKRKNFRQYSKSRATTDYERQKGDYQDYAIKYNNEIATHSTEYNAADIKDLGEYLDGWKYYLDEIEELLS